MTRKNRTLLIFLFVISMTGIASAQDKRPDSAGQSAEELAKKLANPVAKLISVPIQNNTDYGIGTNNGSKNTLNVQPVIPIQLSSKVNMIVRVIVPIISQRDISAANTSQVGLSDINASIYFAPSDSKGIIWAIGPAVLIPTATNTYLGTGKLSLGPSALVLKQAAGLTFGALVNQLWSVAGGSGRTDVSQLYLQPFLTHNWKSGAGLGINAELTKNWEANTFTGSLNPSLSGVTKLGKQTVQLAIGPRIPVAGPTGFKPDFGFRGTFILVFPK